MTSDTLSGLLMILCFKAADFGPPTTSQWINRFLRVCVGVCRGGGLCHDQIGRLQVWICVGSQIVIS